MKQSHIQKGKNMASINKVTILGRLGSDPEIRTVQSSGAVVANISVATSEAWIDKQTGSKQERTEWHKCVFFGKLAEIVQKYLLKGSQVYIEGSLRTNKWEDKNGVERFQTQVICKELVMLGNGQKQNQQQQNVQQQNVQQQNPQPAQANDKPSGDNVWVVPPENYNDDLPF